MRARSSTSALAVLAVATALLLVLPTQASGAAASGVRPTGGGEAAVTTILARDTTPDSTAVLHDTDRGARGRHDETGRQPQGRAGRREGPLSTAEPTAPREPRRWGPTSNGRQRPTATTRSTTR